MSEPVPELAPESGTTAERDVLDEVEALIGALDAHPDARVGEQVTALLSGIDAVHRTALSHLMDAIRGMGGDAFVNRLTADPAIRLLLMSYDLVAVDRRIQTEEALDVVRGHLHTRGVDVELLDVVGSVVYARLHGLEASGLPPDAVRHDIESALGEGLLGFQELVLGDRRPSASSAVVSLGGLRRAQRPVYRAVFGEGELQPGQMRAVDIDGTPILVANADGELYAVANHCGESPLPLQYGTLTGAELVCSWHGCRYDLRTGKRLDGESDRLAVFPVTAADGEVRVAIGTEPVP